MQIIKWFPGAAWRQEVAIDGKSLVLKARWNAESGRWTLDISDRNQNELVNGIALVCGQPLLRLHVDERLPTGDLFVVSSSDPGYDSFLTGQSELFYLTKSELENAAV